MALAVGAMLFGIAEQVVVQWVFPLGDLPRLRKLTAAYHILYLVPQAASKTWSCIEGEQGRSWSAPPSERGGVLPNHVR